MLQDGVFPTILLCALALLGLAGIGVVFIRPCMKKWQVCRQLMHRVPSIILRLDRDGTITFTNEYAERFYGYDRDELLGRPFVGALVPEKSLGGEPVRRYLSRWIEQRTAPFNETLNLRKTGEAVWVSWSVERVPGPADEDEMLCVGTDITDRKLMEEALRQSERQHRLLAENVSDVIWGLDANSNYTYVSPSDEAVRGFKRGEVLGRPIDEFLTPASREMITQTVGSLVDQISETHHPSSTAVSLEFLKADGSTVWLETRLGLLLNEQDEVLGLQGVGRDITDRLLAETLREDVERMARHDLKTPLGAVIGLPNEIRLKGAVNEMQDRMLTIIEEAGESMLQLINRSLDLFKMEQGTYVLETGTVDLLKLLDLIKGELETLIREKGVSMGIEVRGGDAMEGFPVKGERDLLSSMLSNLVLNAVQACPEGGAVTIMLEKGSPVTVTIRNQGEVPPEVRETFFDKYSSTNTADGTGLGTYSARLIARTHGGDVFVTTDVPGETSVVVSLPA